MQNVLQDKGHKMFLAPSITVENESLNRLLCPVLSQ